jgi:hypothetical protein
MPTTNKKTVPQAPLMVPDKESEKFDDYLKYVQENVTTEAKKRSQELVATLGYHFFLLRDSKAMAGAQIYLNEAVLVHVCNAFYSDIFRINGFHAVSNAPDEHKKAAHIFKWISRLCPVYPATNDQSKLKGIASKANSWFAMVCALSFLEINAFTLSASEREHIIYSSTYRDIQPQEWSMIFYLLEKLHIDTGNSLSRIKQFLSQNQTQTLHNKTDLIAQLKELPADATGDLLLKLLDLALENKSRALQLIKESLH